MTKVSIITPSFNSELTIERCIQSVKYQKIDIEHVVIDGASVDKLQKLLMDTTGKILIRARL